MICFVRYDKGLGNAALRLRSLDSAGSATWLGYLTEYPDADPDESRYEATVSPAAGTVVEFVRVSDSRVIAEEWSGAPFWSFRYDKGLGNAALVARARFDGSFFSATVPLTEFADADPVESRYQSAAAMPDGWAGLEYVRVSDGAVVGYEEVAPVPTPTGLRLIGTVRTRGAAQRIPIIVGRGA